MPHTLIFPKLIEFILPKIPKVIDVAIGITGDVKTDKNAKVKIRTMS